MEGPTEGCYYRGPSKAGVEDTAELGQKCLEVRPLTSTCMMHRGLQSAVPVYGQLLRQMPSPAYLFNALCP